MKRALVLPGGLPQITLIKELKKRNITTILADGAVDPLARPYADIFYQIPIFNVDAVKKLAIQEKVDFIVTVCADQVLLVVSKVSEMLNLPCYIDYKTAQMVSDKEIMKKVFVENNIPTSAYVVMDQLDRSKLKGLKYPLVVKPVDAYSSKGVRKVYTSDELENSFTNARKISRKKNVVIEEFCPGSEISVDVFVTGGDAQILSITNSDKIKNKDHFVIFRGRYPANIRPDLVPRIKDIVQNIADSFNIQDSPMLVQLIYDGENLSVLEFCARSGGAMKYLLIEYSSGVDVIKGVVDLTLGIKPEITVKPAENKLIVNDFLYCNPGKLDQFIGFTELLEEGIIEEFHPLRPKGRLMRNAKSSSDRVAGMLIQAKDVTEFNQKLQKIKHNVQVLDTNGDDILRHDLMVPLENI